MLSTGNPDRPRPYFYLVCVDTGKIRGYVYQLITINAFSREDFVCIADCLP
jgi:hypothetical protein